MGRQDRYQAVASGDNDRERKINLGGIRKGRQQDVTSGDDDRESKINLWMGEG